MYVVIGHLYVFFGKMSVSAHLSGLGCLFVCFVTELCELFVYFGN